MGQLERYGLYVLCLVIVLILGVAIWGGDPAVPPGSVIHDLANTEGGAARGVQGGADPALLDDGQGSGDDSFFDRRDLEVIDIGDVHAEDDLLEGLAVVAPEDTTPATPPGEGRLRERRREPETRPQTEPRPRETAPKTTPAKGRQYTVKNNDTLDGIARRLFGSSRYVAAIQNLNPKVDPLRMRPGTVLDLPAKGSVSARGRKGDGGWRTYVVRQNDNPYTISKAIYGTHKHAAKIMEANGITDPRKIRVGAELKIPPVK